MNPPDYTELLQEIKRLNARIEELESKNKALSAENEELKKLLHEQGALKGAKKPEFKEDYSVEKSKGFGKKGRGRQATGRRSQDEKADQVSQHEDLYEVGVAPEDCIEHRQQFAWRFREGRAEYVEQTLIRLQNELVKGIDALFVFVAHPEVEATNNRSERNVRREAEVRKGGRTSQSEAGAKRRGIIMTVLATLNTRFEHFTLEHLVDELKIWAEVGYSTFQAEPANVVNAIPPPVM